MAKEFADAVKAEALMKAQFAKELAKMQHHM